MDFQQIPGDLLPDQPQEFIRILNGRLRQLSLDSTSTAQLGAAAVLSTTHEMRIAGRPKASDHPGALLFETNRGVTYASTKFGAAGYQWVYCSGELIDPDAAGTLVLKPSGLGKADKGFRYRSQYYGRSWLWNGTAWHYAAGGPGAGAQVSTSGPAPQGGLWGACDGSSHQCALDNCTVGSLTSSNAAASGGNNPMIMGGGGGGQQAATAPTYAGSSTVASDADSGAGIAFLAAGTGSTAAASPHTHDVTVPNINAPSETNGGLPLRVSLCWWMRR